MLPLYRRCFTALSFVGFLASSPVLAQGVDPDTDHRIFKAAASRVSTYTQFTIFDDVRASVDEGVVTLTGKVTMPYKRNDIERRIARVDGVRQVVNRIDVLPVSIFDDELRHRIARQIYSNPSFWHYAAMANPPIHIVVDRGQGDADRCRDERGREDARAVDRDGVRSVLGHERAPHRG